MEDDYSANTANMQKKTALVGAAVLFLAVLLFVASPIIIGKLILAQVGGEESGEAAEANFTSSINNQILNLNDQIQGKKNSIEKLKKQSERYRKTIEQKRTEALSLANEMAIIDNQIAKTKIDIETAEVEIDKTKLEIKAINKEIAEKEKVIEGRKNRLAEYLRAIYKNDQTDYLNILLLNNSFSEFFDQLKYLENAQTELRDVLREVIAFKNELDAQKRDLEKKEKELENLIAELEDRKNKAEEKAVVKRVLLDETKQSEKKFQSLLAQLKREQQQIDNEVAALEKTIRKKLEENDSDFQPGDQIILSWPIPFKGITTYFHDPDYPFRYIFEHPALDLRASHGTPIRAPASGYVGRVKDGGFGYSYLMLIHSGGISTVYGHISRAIVQEDTYVSRGQIVGYTGGTPGTRGAGRLTTGPHLHFEVRSNGIPVNPLDYLIDF